MDISLVVKDCIKLKGKRASFVIDPEKDTPKITGDAILLSGSLVSDISRVTDSRVILRGPGEYEVSGSKTAAVATPKCVIYKLSIDNINIILGKSVDFSKLESNFTACDVAVLNVDDGFNESFVTSLAPKIVVLYGEKRLDGAKKLGAQNLSPVAKYSIAKDKLPEKTEVVVLG